MLALLAQATPAISAVAEQALAWIEHGVALTESIGYIHHFSAAALGGAATLAHRAHRRPRNGNIFQAQQRRRSAL